MEFLQSLLFARTFWTETVQLGAMILVLLLVPVGMMYVRNRTVGARSRQFWKDCRGSAEASDFALTFPILLLVILMIVQLAMALNASIIVHYAAYSAARASRAHAWERTEGDIYTLQQLRRRSEAGGNRTAATFFADNARNIGRTCQRAADAARLALIAATPSTMRSRTYTSPQGSGCRGSTAWPAIQTYAGRVATLAGANSDVILTKARYAFSPQNTSVVVRLSELQQARALYAGVRGKEYDSLPVTAEVTFQYPLTLPMGPFGRLFGARAPDGLYKRRLSATVELL